MNYFSNCDTVDKLQFDFQSFVSGNEKRNLRVTLPKLKVFNQKTRKTDLTIIGAGLIGVGLAARAWHEGFKAEKLTILDKSNYFIENFDYRTKLINQKVMRSPYSQHLAPNEDLGLADFARLRSNLLNKGEKKQLQIARKFERSLPPLDIFLSHTASVIKNHNLQSSAFNFNVHSIQFDDDKNRWIIQDQHNNSVETKYLILALGQEGNGVNKQFISSCSNNYGENNTNKVIVSGSGNTAGHVIVDMIKKGKKVDWLIRNEANFLCSDVPHDYFRDEGQLHFMSYTLKERKDILDKLFKGSCMLEHYKLFKKFIKKGLLSVYENCEIENLFHDGSCLKVQLKDQKILKADQIVRAHGLRPAILPQEMPTLEYLDGFPILEDSTLEAKGQRNLYFASIHSALSLGPASKLVDGARLANERIFTSIRAKEQGLQNKEFLRPRNAFWGQITAVTEPV